MMTLRQWLMIFLALVIGSAGLAQADWGRRHDRVRSSIGIVVSPYWAYSGYAYPHYPAYSAPMLIEREPPQIYIERTAPSQTAAPAPTDYWYYCEPARAYYPYVSECRDGWKKVLPQTPEPR